MERKRLIRKFDQQARIYERRRRQQTEREWREKLISSARGEVLEVAVGAGANCAYYRSDVTLTAVDFSGVMLARAKEAAAEAGLNASFLQADLESIDYPEDSFDTIVSTLSMCGYDDPVRMLQAMGRWCKPDGQILLMEHGLSTNRLINGIQHLAEPLFHRIVGCHLNRNLSEILERSGLRVMRMERHLFQMFHLIWAKPNK
jgi:ubiquinone/menaquinone biosynthesis C-methylase UbiE